MTLTELFDLVRSLNEYREAMQDANEKVNNMEMQQTVEDSEMIYNTFHGMVE